MRTPTITTPLDDSCDPAGWRAETVDPRGWLAGNGSSSLVRPTVGVTGDGSPAEPATEKPDRRPGRARRRRRVRAHAPARSLAALRAGSSVDVGAASPGRSESAADPDIDGYRLGRWARLALTVTVLAAVVVITVSLVGSSPQAMVDITVGPGDTLWSIAAATAPDRDPRDVIEEIRALNAVTGDALPVGIVLRVPSTVD